MTDTEILDIRINLVPVMKELENIEEKRKEVDKALENTQEKTKDTWRLAVGVAQASWSLTSSIFDAVGIKLSATMRAVISGAFSAISLMSAIASAAAVTPGMQLAAGLSFVGIAAAIGTAIATDLNASIIEQGLNTGESMLNEISNFIGAFD